MAILGQGSQTMSETLFDRHVAGTCPDEFRNMVSASNEYANLLTRYLDGDESVTEAACIEAKARKIQAESLARIAFHLMLSNSSSGLNKYIESIAMS